MEIILCHILGYYSCDIPLSLTVCSYLEISNTVPIQLAIEIEILLLKLFYYERCANRFGSIYLEYPGSYTGYTARRRKVF